jgi:hypothetical protein
MTPRKYGEPPGETTGEDLPRLKMLAAAIRAEKADAMTVGPGLAFRGHARFISQSNGNQGTICTICTLHDPTHLSTPLPPAAAARDSSDSVLGSLARNEVSCPFNPSLKSS